MVTVRLIGPALFGLLLLVGALAAAAIVRELARPRTMARQFGPPAVPARPGASRPCAVYEIDLTDGRRYIGYGFNPHQRIMQSHRRAKWWVCAATAGATFEPDRVDWFDDEDIAHAEEVRRIRTAKPGTLVNRVLYKTGAAKR